MKNLVKLFLTLTLLFGSHFAVAEVVNINTADAQTLAANIIGVGEKRALAIIAFRDEHGPFKSVDELTQVKGIALKLVDKNRENLAITDVK
ncbi:MAG: helix-hairpin-helix domain-containing protein [Gammaproteobacteria bacterium]|nr:helix-hairpin-helix domain-containing protein [Gammaproteobacteria bacterium]